MKSIAHTRREFIAVSLGLVVLPAIKPKKLTMDEILDEVVRLYPKLNSTDKVEFIEMLRGFERKHFALGHKTAATASKDLADLLVKYYG